VWRCNIAEFHAATTFLARRNREPSLSRAVAPAEETEDRKMRKTISLAAIAAAAALTFAVPQAANATPAVGGGKEINKSNVEKTHYRGYRRGYYKRHYRYGHRHYRRRPGFGIYLGF
jgi:hypothetical protein